MVWGRDAQPDIICEGDPLLHGLHRWRARVSWLSYNIRIEARAAKNPMYSEQRQSDARWWIKTAWALRRTAQHNVRAYEGLIAEREG